MAKADKKAKKEAVEYAASDDTATLERPSSRRDQRALLQAAPPAMAFQEVQTPGAQRLESEDGGTVVAFAKTRTNENNSEVTEVECPNGHSAGKGEATTGTVGKTATCSECGQLLRPVTLINNDTGEEIEFVKKGDRRLVKSTKPKGKAGKASGEDAGGRIGGKGVEVDAETGAGMAKKSTAKKARKSTKKAA